MNCVESIADCLSRYDSATDWPTKETKRALRFMRELRRQNQAAWDQVNEVAERCTFSTRNYGGGNFFTWARLNGVELGGDPWPAARYPKAVLCVEVARRMLQSESERAASA